MTKLSKTVFFILFLTAVAVIGFAFYGGKPQAQDNNAFTAAQKEALGPVIREYLLENPEVVIEAVDAYQRQQESQMQAQQEASIKEYQDFLYSNDKSPSVGNPEGDITIVEFYDYNCGYCKRAFKEVQTILEQDENIRVVLKDMPILSPTSHLAAQWALAAQRQDKYFEYHAALMNHSGAINENSLRKIGEELGLDVEKLAQDAQDPAISATIAENLAASQAMGIRGTPAFIINDRLIGGYIDLDGMKQIIADIRAEG